jgi:hypothetical protein
MATTSGGVWSRRMVLRSSSLKPVDFDLLKAQLQKLPNAID